MSTASAPRAPPTIAPRRRRRSIAARASTATFDDAEFAAKTRAAFDAQPHGDATTEQARVLWECGFVALDVRARAEIEFEGKIPNPPKPGAARGDRALEVPLVDATRAYDAELKKKVYAQRPVDARAFEAAVRAALGGCERGVLVMDDAGGARARRAREILVASGFRSVVAVVGGANAWKRAWDANMRRRQLPGAFSRGFDNAMFAESNVVAEEFGACVDDTVWIV
jgi:rhodanese-related sulfurtransferase